MPVLTIGVLILCGLCVLTLISIGFCVWGMRFRQREHFESQLRFHDEWGKARAEQAQALTALRDCLLEDRKDRADQADRLLRGLDARDTESRKALSEQLDSASAEQVQALTSLRDCLLEDRTNRADQADRLVRALATLGEHLGGASAEQVQALTSLRDCLLEDRKDRADQADRLLRGLDARDTESRKALSEQLDSASAEQAQALTSLRDCLLEDRTNQANQAGQLAQALTTLSENAKEDRKDRADQYLKVSGLLEKLVNHIESAMDMEMGQSV